MLLFKIYTLEFEFDRRLEHMGRYQRMQSELPVILVGEFGALEIFMQNDRLAKPDFSFFKIQTSKIDHTWTEYDHILLSTDHKSTLLRFWFMYKA